MIAVNALSLISEQKEGEKIWASLIRKGIHISI